MTRSPFIAPRRGYTVTELIAVVLIVCLLAALVLPGLSTTRTPRHRLQCLNNLRNIALSVRTYELSHERFPPGGNGIDEASLVAMRNEGKPPKRVVGLQSPFTYLLPHIEMRHASENYDWSRAYNDPAVAKCTFPNANPNETWNSFAAKQRTNLLKCSANPFLNHRDLAGYETTDYMPVTFTDIDPDPDSRGIVGLRNPLRTAIGAFGIDGSRIDQFTDGLSQTIIVVESVGRIPENIHPYMVGELDDPLCPPGTKHDSCTASGRRAFWRWAEPTCAGGISGKRNHGANGNRVPPIGTKANTKTFGGGWEMGSVPALSPPAEGTDPRCYWKWTNCGPNDEIFTFHVGPQVAFADGHVTMLNPNIGPEVLRYLLTRDEATPQGVTLPD